jgi:hypothetical protein
MRISWASNEAATYRGVVAKWIALTDEFNQPALVDSVIRGEEPEFLNVSRRFFSSAATDFQ